MIDFITGTVIALMLMGVGVLIGIEIADRITDDDR